MTLVNGIEHDFGYSKIQEQMSSKKRKQAEIGKKYVMRNKRRDISFKDSYMAASQQVLPSQRILKPQNRNSVNLSHIVIETGESIGESLTGNVQDIQPTLNMYFQNNSLEEDIMEHLPSVYQEPAQSPSHRHHRSLNFPSLHTGGSVVQQASTRTKAKHQSSFTSGRFLMHVNKHIPPYQLFHHLKKSEIARFERDYHGDLAPLLIDFDGKIIDMFNTRKDRFAHWQETSLASIDTSRQDEDELRKQAYNFLVNDVRSLRDLYKE